MFWCWWITVSFNGEKPQINQRKITTISDLQPIDQLDDMKCEITVFDMAELLCRESIHWDCWDRLSKDGIRDRPFDGQTSTDTDFMADELQCRHVQSKSQLPVRFVRYRLDSRTAAVNAMPDVSQSSRPAAAEPTVCKSNHSISAILLDLRPK